MPLLALTKEVKMFMRACEHLLSMPSSPICDDEAALVNYYIEELLHKYGADVAGSTDPCTTGQREPVPAS